MRRVVTVLRSGGEFKPEHVQAMQRQVERWAPEAEFTCLSDVDVPGVECIRLRYDWPGWWAKLELFRPEIRGDFLFTDLDNVILGPISHFFSRNYTTLQRGGWTALMWLPEAARARIWSQFIACPEHWVEFFAQENRPRVNGVGNYGDAGFISTYLGDEYVCWDDVFPGQTLNIVELFQRTALGPRWLNIPPDVRVMLCGRPYRPWKMAMFWKYRLYGDKI